MVSMSYAPPTRSVGRPGTTSSPRLRFGRVLSRLEPIQTLAELVLALPQALHLLAEVSQLLVGRQAGPDPLGGLARLLAHAVRARVERGFVEGSERARRIATDRGESIGGRGLEA